MDAERNLHDLKFSVTFNVHGERAVRKTEDFIENIVLPLKEKYLHAKIHYRGKRLNKKVR